MSFSSDVKEELSKLNTFGNVNFVYAELYGYLMSVNIKENKNKITFSTTSEYNINRFGKLLAKLKIIYNIHIQGKNFIIEFNKENIDFSFLNIETEYDKKAVIRGAFMGGGLINNPINKYHLEIVLKSKDNKNLIRDYINEFEIKNKELERKRGYSIYIKDGEAISNFLAIIGANISVVRYEEIRVIKDKRNKVNRQVNCETANLNKTIEASLSQIDAINKIKSAGKFDELPEGLKEISLLRIENEDLSLNELGKLLNKPIGRSGVNHRLNKIIKIASEIK